MNTVLLTIFESRMITVLLFLSFFNGYILQGDDSVEKPIYCAFSGNKVGTTSTALPVMNPQEIPRECTYVIFTDCQIKTTLSCNLATIKKIVELKFSVILNVFREYKDWLNVLKPDGNALDAKNIIDYITTSGASGVLLDGLASRSTKGTPNGTLAANVIPYLEQLKSDNYFVIGVSLDPYSYILFNPNVFNYKASENLVTFYLINTYRLNPCNFGIFNGDSPIQSGEIVSLENVVTTVNATDLFWLKVYFVIDLLVDDPSNRESLSYNELCTTTTNTDQWCAPTTKDYYDKAKYLTDLGIGIAVFWIEFDDVQNTCGCGSLMGFKNIMAAYNGENQIPCAKFDIKANFPSP